MNFSIIVEYPTDENGDYDGVVGRGEFETEYLVRKVAHAISLATDKTVHFYNGNQKLGQYDSVNGIVQLTPFA